MTTFEWSDSFDAVNWYLTRMMRGEDWDYYEDGEG